MVKTGRSNCICPHDRRLSCGSPDGLTPSRNPSFLDESSLHGLKYLGHVNSCWQERIFWGVACSVAFICGIFLIYKVFEKSTNSPVLVSFASDPTPIWEIPFPALTICNMNKVRASKVKEVLELWRNNPDDLTLQQEVAFIDEVCESHAENETEEIANEDEAESHSGLDLSNDQVHHFLDAVSHSCEDMLVQCHFEGAERDCKEIFISVITDDGQCCGFNVMPESVMFRNRADQDKEEEKRRWSNWDMQDGYRHEPNKGKPDCGQEESGHSVHKRSTEAGCKTEDGSPPRWLGEEMPRRAVAPGLHMGLTVTLNTQVEESYCTGFQSTGFKGLLHVPVSQPEMVEYGFALSPGTENFHALDPQLIHADPSLHKITPTKRQCYLQGEKHLQYYEHYTLLNCLMECEANVTYNHCDCNMYFQPRTEDHFLCTISELDCYHTSVKYVEESAFAGASDGEYQDANCECLPSCTDYEFPAQTSFSKINSAAMLHLPARITTKYPQLRNDSFVRDNIAILHIYFRHLHFMRNERDELYGQLDIISNIGGLLGLCMGFSMLSAVEMVYFVVKRVVAIFTRK